MKAVMLVLPQNVTMLMRWLKHFARILQ